MFKTAMLEPSILLECGEFKAVEWRPSYKEFMALKLQGALGDSKTINFGSFGILFNNGPAAKLEVNGEEYCLKTKGVSLIVKGASVKLPQGEYDVMICLENDEQNIEFC